jgi:hypothetical protein
MVADAPPKSATTYGALSILANLTRYRPVLTDEQAKMRQLKAYADAKGKLAATSPGDPLDEDDRVAQRCRLVFDAGVVPVLVTHTAKTGSPASMALAVAVIYALSVTPALRGPLAQQGAVKMLIATWTALGAIEKAPSPSSPPPPSSSSPPSPVSPTRRTAAQALARILININPVLVLGGNRPTPLASAVRPLASIVAPDSSGDVRDLLPTFEALMALTNLASVEDPTTRRLVVDAAWPAAEEQLLSSNPRVAKAAVELACNLAQSPEGMALYVAEAATPPTPDAALRARERMHVLLALADAEDSGIRSAAGGALAGLTAHPSVVDAILFRPGGVAVVLGLVRDPAEDMRHRGAVAAYNMVAAPGDSGKRARAAMREQGAVAALTDCARESRRAEVVECTVQALKELVSGQ